MILDNVIYINHKKYLNKRHKFFRSEAEKTSAPADRQVPLYNKEKEI